MRMLPLSLLALAVSACAGTHARHAEDGVRAARVSLASTQGQLARGELQLRQQADGVHVTGTLQGLKPDAEHGFHVHEKGDCSALDASSAGGHYNPTGSAHGNPMSGPHHAGDVPNVRADASGRAQVDVRIGGVSLGAANDIIGRAIVVHADPDDYASQPAGNSGARIACGVIVAD